MRCGTQIPAVELHGRRHRTFVSIYRTFSYSVREPEPFAAVILCTSNPAKVDERMRSKWSRVLGYAAEFKALDEPLRDFVKRKGGINKCATRFARRLGRSQSKTC
jgi:hypothetical protein